jgi:hypothetical protein
MGKSPRRSKPDPRAKKPVKATRRGHDRRTTKKPQATRPPETNLDLRTLIRLSMGDWQELADLEWPPENIRRWLARADLRQVRGLLLTTLHRWHELRSESAGDS